LKRFRHSEAYLSTQRKMGFLRRLPSSRPLPYREQRDFSLRFVHCHRDLLPLHLDRKGEILNRPWNHPHNEKPDFSLRFEVTEGKAQRSFDDEGINPLTDRSLHRPIPHRAVASMKPRIFRSARSRIASPSISTSNEILDMYVFILTLPQKPAWFSPDCLSISTYALRSNDRGFDLASIAAPCPEEAHSSNTR